MSRQFNLHHTKVKTGARGSTQSKTGDYCKPDGPLKTQIG